MDTILNFLIALVQGIVQGITEWLPISSTGHMLLIDQFLHMNVSADPAYNEAFFNLFKVVIQFGSILAVLVLFFHKLNPFSPKKTVPQKQDTWSLWGKVLAASIPAAIVGLLFDDIIEGALSKPVVIAGTLILYGVLFILLESYPRDARIHRFSEMNYRTALLIGAFQMLALIPGTSRSGATILGAVFLGCSRYVAAEFSFFLAIPVMVGASGYKMLGFIKDYGLSFNGTQWLVLLTGMVVAFAVSMLVVRFFIAFVKKHSFKPFGYYRIALGALVILLFLLGVVK